MKSLRREQCEAENFCQSKVLNASSRPQKNGPGKSRAFFLSSENRFDRIFLSQTGSLKMNPTEHPLHSSKTLTEKNSLLSSSLNSFKNGRNKMKKRVLLKTSLLILLSFASLASAEEIAIPPTKKQAKTPFIEYHNRMTVFSALHIAYERIKPNSIYAGVDFWAATNLANLPEPQILGEAEFRMGYNFFYNGRDHFTPVVGIGYLQDFETDHQYVINSFGCWIRKDEEGHHIPGIIYGTAGFLYEHEFNSIFNLGLNIKGLIGGPANRNRHVDWGSYISGFDVSFPVTFRFGHKRHWDYRLEPFDIYIHGTNEHRNYFGFRGAVAYRF
jgi:hypothetical protein